MTDTEKVQIDTEKVQIEVRQKKMSEILQKQLGEGQFTIARLLTDNEMLNIENAQLKQEIEKLKKTD